MEIKIANRANGMRAVLTGQFTFTDNQKFKEVLNLAGAEGVNFIELDFAGIDFIDSAGLGMMLLLRDTCQQKHIPVSIHSIQGQVEKIFTIAKFNQLFSISS